MVSLGPTLVHHLLESVGKQDRDEHRMNPLQHLLQLGVRAIEQQGQVGELYRPHVPGRGVGEG
jgi:hypothetical protein